MLIPIITPENLLKIGFKKVERGDDVLYERAGLRITIGEQYGIACIGSSVEIPLTKLMRELELKLRPYG